jgi:large subunit ribosomal protein L25
MQEKGPEHAPGRVRRSLAIAPDASGRSFVRADALRERARFERPKSAASAVDPDRPARASLQSAAVSGDRLKLEVREREDSGSRRTRRLRTDGFIPGVLYGKGHSRAIVVPERELRAAMTGPSGLHAILDVVIEGQKTVHPSILADYQQDPIRGTISHIDLREVRLDQAIHATVTIQLVGEAAGVKTGGMLSLVAREVQVEALPADVPEHIEVDVSHMEVGDVLRLVDIPAIDKVTLLDDPHETVIATVSVPRGFAELEEAEAAEAEAAAAEAEGEEGAVEGEEGESAEADEGSESEE